MSRSILERRVPGFIPQYLYTDGTVTILPGYLPDWLIGVHDVARSRPLRRTASLGLYVSVEGAEGWRQHTDRNSDTLP